MKDSDQLQEAEQETQEVSDCSDDGITEEGVVGEEEELLHFYRRPNVTNSHKGQAHFDQGLRLLLSYQHEEASHYFLACLKFAPDCALAHALVALCHSPNYNFKGEPYYTASFPPKNVTVGDYFSTLKEEDSKSKETSSMMINPPAFPSQLFADYHSKLAVEKVQELKFKNNNHEPFRCNGLINNSDRHSTDRTSQNIFDKGNGHKDYQQKQETSMEIQQVEVMLINAIRCLNRNPGVDPAKAECINGQPYANAMREVYKAYPNDAEVAYFFVESIMVMHAWNLFDYPTGTPISDDVPEVKNALERALDLHPQHVGLCHMYVHLCEMATYPEKALRSCDVLRHRFPEAGHLLHMPTHIDVLVGDYDSCVRWNDAAITADTKTMERTPETAGISSFYFGYIAHNYHMLIYGAILGAMEEKAMSIAQELNLFLHEEIFVQNPQIAVYLESYSTMDIHVLVRFGRWEEILGLVLPSDTNLMLYRAACIHYAKAIAHANLGYIEEAKIEAVEFEKMRSLPETKNRILHNNSVSNLLDVDSYMIKGEIAYFEGRFEDCFVNLREAVKLQDNLNYDEPWGKMQPIRHALGGLLLKRGKYDEAESVYLEDLRRLPNNPWSLKGLINCIKWKLGDLQHGSNAPNICCSSESKEQSVNLTEEEIAHLQNELKKFDKQFSEQRKSEWADFQVKHSCACCTVESKN